MTKGDFILSVLASLLATILFELCRKLYPHRQWVVIKVITYSSLLKNTVLSGYEFCKESVYQFFRATLMVFEYAKNTLKRLTEELASRKAEYIRRCTEELEPTDTNFIRFQTEVLSSRPRLALALSGLALSALMGIGVGWLTFKKPLEPSRKSLEMELARLNSIPPSEFADRISTTSNEVIEIKTPPNQDGKYTRIRLPKRAYPDDMSSLNWMVNISKDDTCTASLRIEDREAFTIQDCKVYR